MKKNKKILSIIILTIFICLTSSNVFAETITETYTGDTTDNIDAQIQTRLEELGCKESVEDASKAGTITKSTDGQSNILTYKTIEWNKEGKKYTAKIVMFLGQIQGKITCEATVNIEILDENSQSTGTTETENRPKDYDYTGTSFQDLNQQIERDLQIKYLATLINIEEAYKNAKTTASGTKKFTVDWQTSTENYEAVIEEYESNSKYYANVTITREIKTGQIIKPTESNKNLLGTSQSNGSHTPDEIINEANSFIEIGKNNGNPIDGSNLKKASDTLYNILLAIGILLAVVVGMYLGIKFMLASAEDKAKVKESLVPYIAGCIVIFGAFIIWKLTIILFAGMA